MGTDITMETTQWFALGTVATMVDARQHNRRPGKVISKLASKSQNMYVLL